MHILVSKGIFCGKWVGVSGLKAIPILWVTEKSIKLVFSLIIMNEKKLTVTTQLTIFFKKGTFSLKNELLAEKRRVEPQVMVKSYMNLANTLP